MTTEQINPDTAFFFGACLRQPMRALEERALARMPEIKVYRSISEAGAQDWLRNQHRKTVEVWGADAFVCVATAIWTLIVEGGAEQVLLDLSHVREYETDPDSDTEDEMYHRALAIVESLLDIDPNKSLREDQLMLIRVAQCQEQIWKKALTDHRSKLESWRNGVKHPSLLEWLIGE